nr:alcohol dehydrogenase-like 6 [Ipomoea batatas]
MVIEEVEVSPPQPMEIRIKVVYTSLCRSDVTAWLSQAHTSIYPRIFGHEASGIVESVGQGVTEFAEGDHVLTLFTGECMRCKHCISGKSNICQVLGLEHKGVMHSDQKTRFFVKGKPVYHYCAVSSFSEYTVVHAGCAVKVSPLAPLDKICILSCGAAAEFDYSLEYKPGKANIVANALSRKAELATISQAKGDVIEWIKEGLQHDPMAKEFVKLAQSGKDATFHKVCDNLAIGTQLLGLGAAWKVANVSEGSKVAIFGLGTVGLSVAQGAKLRGASQIIGVDTNPHKRDIAKDFGVTDFLNPNDSDEPIQQVIKRMTDGGADFSFECIGDTEMVTTALQSCCDGWGLTVTLGVPKTKPEISSHFRFFLTGRKLTGSLFGGWKPKSEIPSLVDMYMNKV